MGQTPVILDHLGRPIERANLTREIAAPTTSGVRSPISGYPADGLTPMRLANILREADIGDPVRFLELAETIEERDPHYVGVLGTRRRSVAQLDITVEAASEDAQDEAIAQMVRAWLERDELTDEIFDILDCIGKGYSFTEVTYDHSEGQYRPRLIWRDPRSFRFARHDLATPLLLNDHGAEEPLTPGKFIVAQIKAKSGIVPRAGLARIAAWGWMFKMYTQRDWAIFTQTYGQPIRVGRFPIGADEKDKRTLMRAVSNIAGDCAAIVPESMTIEFIESGNVGAAHSLYMERADWIDQQISKAVLGQTATTDAVTGGLGSGKEHREVQKDIEQSDARALAAILNRDLIRPWVQLEFGPQTRFPRLRITRVEQEDLKAFADAVGPMIDRGLEVEQGAILNRFGLPEAKPGAKLMRPSQPAALASDQLQPPSKIKRNPGEIKRVEATARPSAAPQSERPPAGEKSGVSPEDVLADRLALESAPAIEALIAQIEAMTQAAGSLEELREMLLAAYPDLDAGDLSRIIAQGLVAAHAGGRIDAADQSA
jgi:phage gp29-like protein